VSAAGAGLDVYGDVTFGIPDRLRASYRTTTYFNTAPDEPLQRWLTVGADGRVRAFAGKVEYGQGVRSGFAMDPDVRRGVATARLEGPHVAGKLPSTMTEHAAQVRRGQVIGQFRCVGVRQAGLP